MGDCEVFFFSLCEGDLENRAQLREPANILIFNTTRSDTAEYRCEVAAIDDQRDFDEILISLAVRGTVAKPQRVTAQENHRSLLCFLKHRQALHLSASLVSAPNAA